MVWSIGVGGLGSNCGVVFVVAHRMSLLYISKMEVLIKFQHLHFDSKSTCRDIFLNLFVI